jgi:hypothetical protein
MQQNNPIISIGNYLKEAGVIQSGARRTDIGSTKNQKWHNLNRNAWHLPFNFKVA